MKHLKLFGYGLIGAAALALFVLIIKALTLWFIMWEWSPLFFKSVFGVAGIYVLGGVVRGVHDVVRREWK